MSSIRDIHNPWRDRWQQATFRGSRFFVENGSMAGGRRVALHQYPKRNVPYAEDMGKSANRFTVQGYLIGPNYLDDKDTLIEALEKDGPGMLRLPLPYKMRDVQVMVMGFTISEGRERGGMCQVEMEFVEYGDPNYRATTSTPAQIEQSAKGAESAVMGPPAPETKKQTAPYAKVAADASVNDGYAAV
jgi:prophage DNA circulation protein